MSHPDPKYDPCDEQEMRREWLLWNVDPDSRDYNPAWWRFEDQDSAWIQEVDNDS